MQCSHSFDKAWKGRSVLTLDVPPAPICYSNFASEEFLRAGGHTLTERSVDVGGAYDALKTVCEDINIGGISGRGLCVGGV